jgi:glycosyltransferase involved in cell wall biosynthesis
VKTSAPGKFGDYLASETPILAHLPGDSFVSWYLKEYDCGIVVDQDDPDLLAAAILTLIEDPSLRLKLSENAKKRAQVDFNPELARMRFLSAIGLK